MKREKLKDLLNKKRTQYKIISIKKINWFKRTFSMSGREWKVIVELENKTILKLNCFAGWPEVNPESLKYSIENEIAKQLTPDPETEIFKMIGKTLQLE